MESKTDAPPTSPQSADLTATNRCGPIRQAGDDKKRSPANWPNNIVDWDGPDDPEMPMNWPKRKKMFITVLLGFTTMGATFASSSFSPTFAAVSAEFGVSTEVTTLSLSLFVLGFAFGPLLFAPISELYGRKIAFLPAYFVFGIFLIGVATAQNIETVMLCRFFAGLMASAPVSNVAGGLADLWNDHDRGMAVVGFSVAVIGGPTIGPLVGSAITDSYLGWRYTEYITSFLIFFIFTIALFLPETYAPVLLQRKANHLRHVTGNWALHAKSEEEELTAKVIVGKHLARPIVMLVTEPIILCFAVYNAFVYGLLYLLFVAVPIEYEEERGWTSLQGSLVFLAVLVGVLISGGIQAAYQPLFWKQIDQAHLEGKRHNPEARLPPMILGGVLFAAGLFWFGGSSGNDKSAAIGIVGAGCIGSGFILIFQNIVNYLVDAFTVHAASANAANTLLRSLAGAGFPLFASPMFHNLGVSVASYVLGAIAAAMIPIPILFYIYGPAMRGMSRYNPDKASKRGTKQSKAEDDYQV